MTKPTLVVNPVQWTLLESEGFDMSYFTVNELLPDESSILEEAVIHPEQMEKGNNG